MVTINVHYEDGGSTGHINLQPYNNIAIDDEFGFEMANFDVFAGRESLLLANQFIQAAAYLVAKDMRHSADALDHVREHIERELQK